MLCIMQAEAVVRTIEWMPAGSAVQQLGTGDWAEEAKVVVVREMDKPMPDLEQA